MKTREEKRRKTVFQDEERLPPAATAGQSGDMQGLREDADASSESVAELAAEGQSFEAGLVEAIENAPDADASEVKTHEPREDDVPFEYTQKDGAGKPDTQ